MRDIHDPPGQLEVHDPDILAHARAILDACRTPQQMQEAVLAAVARNEEWRGRQCLNLLASEAPTSPTVRALLSFKVGIRAAEGHIGLSTAGSLAPNISTRSRLCASSC